MKRLLLILFIFTITLNSYSTDCLEGTIKDNWGRADIIFDCIVIKKYENTSIYGLSGRLPFTNIVVKKVYKGQAVSENDTITIIFNNSSADFIFEENKEYLIFTRAKFLLNVLKCSGSISKESENYKTVIDSVEFYNSTIDENEKIDFEIIDYDRIETKTKNSDWLIAITIASILANIILIAILIKRK